MLKLLDKFWPAATRVLVTDEILVNHNHLIVEDLAHEIHEVRSTPTPSWCEVVTSLAEEETSPVCLLQEDFFLNAPVNTDLVEQALTILRFENVGAVRLYPCPGATDPKEETFGPVSRYSRYRNSLQATIWKPGYLKAIAERFNTPAEFEIQGSEWASENRPEDVWAFNREVQPWPISYICSAISRGQWEPGALELCRQHGIDVDLSLRSVRDLQLVP
jgi:hypothetical protein